MPGPRVGAVSITDAGGINHYMACPGCEAKGCAACAGAGRLLIYPLVPATAYHPGTYMAMTTPDPLAPSTLAEVDLDGEDFLPDDEDFPTRPGDHELLSSVSI